VIAFLLNAFSLAALVGVEFVIDLVFADLPDHTIDALRDGTLGVALGRYTHVPAIGARPNHGASARERVPTFEGGPVTVVFASTQFGILRGGNHKSH